MIKIDTHPVDTPLTANIKWWGQPDMPENLEYPEISLVADDGEEYQDPLTFVCQIRCDELAPFDPQGLLPHQGMLYFFAALDYYLGNLDTPAYPGLGCWPQQYYRVLYSPSCDNLHTHSIVYDDGTPFGLPAEAITLSTVHEPGDGIRLLGKPYIEEVCEEMPGRLSLLQIDDNERWNLVFHDCGTLNFLITPEDLRNRQWNKVNCFLFSF